MDDKQKKAKENLQFMQSMYPILMSASLSIHIVLELFDNTCSGSAVPADTLNISLIGLKVYPLVTFFLLRDTDLRAILCAWGYGLFIMLVCAIKFQSSDQLGEVVAFSFASTLVFYDSYRQQKAMMQIVEKLQQTLELNDQLAVEAQALELRAMIGNVAHDLKTPLTSLLSGIECLTDMLTEWGQMFHNPNFKWTEEHVAQGKIGNAEMQAVLANMNSTNSFMTMTINRCLDYTKSTNGFKLVPKLETVSLKQSLSMPVKLMQGAQHAIDIAMNSIPDDICSHIITDKQWLIENLLCLLSNASKYSSKGTVTVDVFTVKLNADDILQSPRSRRAMAVSSPPPEAAEYLRFEVQDTGVGLSDDAMQSLFNSFKQAQRLAGGTGLGLFSLAKRVEALHGTYGVMRRPDGEQGSLFWFTIPYRPDRVSAQALRIHRSCLSHSSSSDSNADDVHAGEPTFNLPPLVEGPFKVLVVDDAPLIVKMTTMLLQRKGHTVQHAVNGSDALDKLRVLTGSSPRMRLRRDSSSGLEVPTAQQFDVVLMDLQMPVLDGIEAIRRLRAAEEKQRGPSSDTSTSGGGARQFVIALSANSDEETRREALAAGADAFVPKPFTYESFLNAMQKQL
eukprot:CAMPEP_0184966814 /NCGR_PEP_ID=MMETSP1098-20130426/376_1 /TAXON_ID=89044 /ORGANISM="Spumella elongata, Strain CCAP 955/1" /LENGTH=619 /DNA_ID=CAMNT_0027488157 /DNA_START=366 /DNA_END=2225 /DNA_ORIENTATION=+